MCKLLFQINPEIVTKEVSNSVNFGGHKPCRYRDISFPVYHRTSHEKSYDFVDSDP